MKTAMAYVRTCLAAWALFLCGVGPVRADPIVLTFNPPAFEWHQTGGSATPYHIWVEGDYWAQNFPATGLAAADRMSLTLFIDRNGLAAGNRLNLAVLLNESPVGSFSFPAGLTGSQAYDFDFPAVSGPDYRIEIRATNTIPPGAGAVSIGLGGRSFATLDGTVVPEPASLTLLGCGVLGLLGYAWRRRQRA